MKRAKARRSTTDLTAEQLKQLRKDRALIAVIRRVKTSH